MKIKSLEELNEEKLTFTNKENALCPIKSCFHIGDYVSCYFDTFCLCPIYSAVYSRLTKEQRKVL